MDKHFNVFISHHGKDDKQVQSLKDRLIKSGHNIRNYSVDSTKHKDGRRPSDEVIKRYLKMQVNWSGTFICLIGKETHKRDWVNYEIKQAYLQGKRIIGIYDHGLKEKVELPENYKKYGGTPLGWNSIDKLGDAIAGKPLPSENPDGSKANPSFAVKRIKC